MDRASGVLLHPSSLPGMSPIGGMGQSAEQFLSLLHEAGQKLWQILPLGPTGYGNSPYQSYSAFAGNPLLIDLENLVHRGLITGTAVLQSERWSRIDFQGAMKQIHGILTAAFQQFETAGGLIDAEFQQYCRHSMGWLDDYALYRAIKTRYRGAPWYEWEHSIRMREPAAMNAARNDLDREISFHRFQQFLFWTQWRELRERAHQLGIRIIGDLPIFVALDSADVWAHREMFELTESGQPRAVAGVPPDYFSKDGQLWGNPLYNWARLRDTDYGWWIYRFQCLLELVDVVRIDHFRGFEKYWEVPFEDTTARNGQWRPGPGGHFFEQLLDHVNPQAIIAEDLGFITPEVEQLRDRFRFPGMKILQFAFDSDAANPYLPHNYIENCVVYTGTHDNNTTLGWFQSLSAKNDESGRRTLDHLRTYLCHPPRDISWELLGLAHRSIARWSIVPMQDLLRLPEDARMNLPGTATDNWNWRMMDLVEFENVSGDLKALTELCGR